MKYLPCTFIVVTLKVEVECGKQIWKLIIRTCFIPNHVYVTSHFKEIHEPIRYVNCVLDSNQTFNYCSKKKILQTRGNINIGDDI